MSINIKNPRVHELARQAAALTGQSQTSVIETALQHFLRDLETERSPQTTRARVDRLLADVDARLSDQDRRAMKTADLYDETGLPR